MIPEIVRRFITSALLWCTFVALYLLVVGVLGLGVWFSSESWFEKYRHQATWWTMTLESARVILLALALVFVVALPLSQLIGRWGKSASWRDERRSGSKDRPIRKSS